MNNRQAGQSRALVGVLAQCGRHRCFGQGDVVLLQVLTSVGWRTIGFQAAEPDTWKAWA